jgi:hypothetical protein
MSPQGRPAGDGNAVRPFDCRLTRIDPVYVAKQRFREVLVQPIFRGGLYGISEEQGEAQDFNV